MDFTGARHWEQGARWRKRLIWKQANGDPYDLTGCRGLLQVRTGPGAPVQVELREGDGITFGGADGTIDLFVSGAKAMGLTTRRAQYDFYVIFPSGEPVKVLDGRIEVDLTISDVSVVLAPAIAGGVTV